MTVTVNTIFKNNKNKSKSITECCDCISSSTNYFTTQGKVKKEKEKEKEKNCALDKIMFMSYHLTMFIGILSEIVMTQRNISKVPLLNFTTMLHSCFCTLATSKKK